MKVPDELVEAALVGWLVPAGGEIEDERRKVMRKALEAVLPKVRERLLAEAGDPGWGLTEDQHDDLGSIFDHAFPEDG